MPVLVAAMALLGLAVGSFLNVVIYRVPRNESLVRPSSHCPSCDTHIRARHNVPLVGWLVLRGKCADCAAPISARYPIVELITSVLFAATTIQLADLHLLAALPAYLFFVSAGVALAVIDLDVHRLPNAIVYPSYAALAVLLTAAAAVEGSFEPLARAAVGGAVLFSFFLALAFASPKGMGLGDVKLAGVIGAVLGFLSYPAIFVGTFAAFLLGGVAGAALIVARRAGRKSLIPFGPALVAGAFIALFASGPLVDAYSTLAHTA
ncbi:prepilin peptidase [uncultured Jatrophihabitans sp.]|uniref:prepilin peptidase n=1 Tax=uncultured Jatrophihabitans sp. TaxID=1610747 RepID=UPI0035CA55BE